MGDGEERDVEGGEEFRFGVGEVAALVASAAAVTAAAAAALASAASLAAIS